MRIAILAPLWKKVPPEKYGGSELVVADLAEGLTSLNHKVTTFACAGSTVAGELVPVIEKPMFELVSSFVWNAVQPYEFLTFFELGKRIKDFDIVHNHMGFHPIGFAPFLTVPMVTTLHSSLKPDFPFLADRFKDENFVSISNSQRQLAPNLNYVETVYHGIDTSKFEPSYSQENNYLTFIGSLTPFKGIDLAIKAAIDLGEKLIIAGDIRPEYAEFVEKEVKPFIDGEQIKFLGEINHAEKNQLLKNAKAFVFPVRWNEAFGLVIAESLACGTPVISFANGAIPEIVEHGKTGYIAKDFEELKEYIKNVSSISRQLCRHQAEARFDRKIMAQNYAQLFMRLLE